MAATLITDEMRSILGKTIATMVSYPVSASDIRRWAIAVYYPETPPRRFWDEEYARTTPYGGIVAPEEFNAFAWGAQRIEQAAPAGAETADAAIANLESRLGVQPPALKNVLNGGLEHLYTRVPTRVGDVVTATSSIGSYKEREGRLGQMLFSTMETMLVNQRDELVRTQRLTLIRY